MKSYIWFLLVVPALALGSGLCRGYPEVPAGPAKGTVLILHTERTMEGDIYHKGNLYSIRRGPAEVTIPADKVLRLCQDWDEAFGFMKSRAHLGDPDERLRLAKWCHVNNLREYALAEAKAALDMRPAHLESKQLFTIFKKHVEEAQSNPSPPPETVPNLPPPPQIDISSDSLALFTTRIQPILLNACANCHSQGKGGSFQLNRSYEGGQRTAVQRNLATVLAHLNMDRPALSPFLLKAVSLHGNLTQAPIRSRESEAYKTLHQWVELVVANNPQLREQRWPSSPLAAPAMAPRDPILPNKTPPQGTETSPVFPQEFPTKPGPEPYSSGSEFASNIIVSSTVLRVDPGSKLPTGFNSKSPAPFSPGTTPKTNLEQPGPAQASLPRNTETAMTAGFHMPQFPEPASTPLTLVKGGLPRNPAVEVETKLFPSPETPRTFQQLAAFPLEASAPHGVPSQAPPRETSKINPPAPEPSAPAASHQMDPYNPDLFNRQMHPQR